MGDEQTQTGMAEPTGNTSPSALEPTANTSPTPEERDPILGESHTIEDKQTKEREGQ
ncbi:MAG: hypothetical protein QOI51_334 [Nocardioidaceae bacterium]|jgi:hypothetical protein|nr:hypothetical protein [Nocardioidaceae bacterium]